MKVLLKTICDDAFHNRESGNLNIIGIFENIKVSKFPAIHGKTTFAFILSGEPVTEFEYSMVIFDTKKVKVFESPKAKGKIGPNGRGHLTVHVNNITFKHEGVHTAEFDFGDTKESFDLNVEKISK